MYNLRDKVKLIPVICVAIYFVLLMPMFFMFFTNSEDGYWWLSIEMLTLCWIAFCASRAFRSGSKTAILALIMGSAASFTWMVAPTNLALTLALSLIGGVCAAIYEINLLFGATGPSRKRSHCNSDCIDLPEVEPLLFDLKAWLGDP